MEEYVCDLCDYMYNPEKGDPKAEVAPGTKWEDVPETWTCPICGAGKSDFFKKGSEELR